LCLYWWFFYVLLQSLVKQYWPVEQPACRTRHPQSNQAIRRDAREEVFMVGPGFPAYPSLAKVVGLLIGFFLLVVNAAFLVVGVEPSGAIEPA
jgi:hypothetical protein